MITPALEEEAREKARAKARDILSQFGSASGPFRAWVSRCYSCGAQPRTYYWTISFTGGYSAAAFCATCPPPAGAQGGGLPKIPDRVVRELREAGVLDVIPKEAYE